MTAKKLRKMIEAHKADGSPTDVLDLALWALTAREALLKYEGIQIQIEEVDSPGVVKVSEGDFASECLAKFPEQK